MGAPKGNKYSTGRPKGAKGKTTLEKEMALAAFKERVMKAMFPLLDSQMNLAKGCQYLYRVDGVGKATLVTNPEEIQEYFEGKTDEEKRYLITTEKPDNKAIDSLLDRTFGKATQRIETDTPEVQEKIKTIEDGLRSLINIQARRDRASEVARQNALQRRGGQSTNTNGRSVRDLLADLSKKVQP